VRVWSLITELGKNISRMDARTTRPLCSPITPFYVPKTKTIMEERRYPMVIFEVKHEDGRIEFQQRYDISQKEYEYLDSIHKIVFPVKYDKK